MSEALFAFNKEPSFFLFHKAPVFLGRSGLGPDKTGQHNMAVKGKQREQKEFVKELFVGFTSVKVIGLNPNLTELNKLLGRETAPDQKEPVYLGTDQEGHERLRLAFWLRDDKNDKLFVHSFNLTNKERKNKDGDKCQLVNSTCSTSWAPYVKKGENITDKVDESVVQEWFKNFTDKEKNVLGPKKFRKALAGEEELVTFVRSWLGRLNFMDTETEVLIDTKKLFKENYKELRELISLDENEEFSSDGLDTPFVILLGVRTDEDDSTKKYQQVWSKAFLPNGFMKYINNGLKFPTDYAKKVWSKFKEEVEGEYGFDGYTELVPLVEYNGEKDMSGTEKSGKEIAPTDPNY